MKTTNSTTSLSCRVVRFWSVVVHSGTPDARHLAQCDSCRSYFASAQQLETALRQEARRAVTVVPNGTEDRIIRAIRNAAPAQREERNPFFKYALVGGAVTAAAVAVFQYSTTHRAGPAPMASAPDYRSDAAELAEAVRALPSGLQKSIGQPASALTQNNALQREVQGVYSDAQSALAFLRMNFLPGEAEARPSST